MSKQEQQTNISNLQTLETELALSKQEMEEFRKLPKEEQEKQKDEKLAQLNNLNDKLDQLIQEAIQTGDFEEVKRLKEELNYEVNSLELLANDKGSVQYRIELLTGQIPLDNDDKILQKNIFDKDENVSTDEIKRLITEANESIEKMFQPNHTLTDYVRFSDTIEKITASLDIADQSNVELLKEFRDKYREYVKKASSLKRPSLLSDSFEDFLSNFRKRYEENLEKLQKKGFSESWVNALSPKIFETREISLYYFLSKLNLAPPIEDSDLEKFADLLVWYEKRILEITVEFYKGLSILNKNLPLKGEKKDSMQETAIKDLNATESLYSILIKAGVDLSDIEDVEKVIERVRENIELQK